MRETNSEYEWVQYQDLSEFKGKWIAVINKKIVGSGLYADDVAKEVKKKTKETPFLIKVPHRRLSITLTKGISMVKWLN